VFTFSEGSEVLLGSRGRITAEKGALVLPADTLAVVRT
jgi:hypothetical protein